MNPRAAWDKLSADGRKIAVAIAISILLHLLIVLTAAVVMASKPAVVTPPPEEEPLEFTIVDPPPEPPKKSEPAYVDTSVDQQKPDPTKDAPFESDKNTAASSAQTATSDAPIPTQDGKEVPGMEFENKKYTAGKEPRPSSPPAPPPQPEQAATTTPPAEKDTPKKEEEPKPTPPQISQLALLEPPRSREVPKPNPEDQQKPPDPQKPQPPTKPSQPSNPSTPGYQPETQITRIRGNISNRGRASVAANATPLGRYKKMLADAIGSRWYYYVNEQMGLLSVGTVELRFIVTANGKAEKVQVVSNTSNETFASCSVGAIMEAEIPPIPKELLPMLQGGRIEIEYTFSILSN